jgi:hypothetical protein
MSTEIRRLTDEQIAEVMKLLKDSDSVELKVTIPQSAHRATIQGLGIDPVEAEPRQVFFLDTPDLALNAAGVVVRARRVAGGRGDTVVKLRPVVPADLPAEIRSDAAFNVEVDILPGGFVCSGSYKGKADNAAISAAVAGEVPLSSIFSKQQRAFYKEHAPDGIGLDSLTVLGPTFVLKAKEEPEEFGRKIVGEMWLYPDGSRILEISTKCLPAETFTVAAEARVLLSTRGIVLGGEQQTKTRTALDYFAAQLAEARA